jgi:hypothetical protein
MCPERLSLSFQIMKATLPDAERVMPGRGCELVNAMATVSDMALVVGLVTGLALAWLLYDIGSCVLNSRRYRAWKASRHAD